MAGISDYLSSYQVDNLNANYSKMLKSMEKLSSGLRINRASDGPADLVISEQLRASIASLDQQIKNMRNNSYRYEVGQSAAMELRSYLTDMRTIAVQASNEGFNSAEAQTALNKEAQALVDSYNRVRTDAEFNGWPLLDGSEGALAGISNLEGIDMTSSNAAQMSIETIDQAITEVDNALVDMGATQKYEFESEIRSLEISRENLTAAESSIRDTDYTNEYLEYILYLFRMKMGIAMQAHNKMTADSVISLFK